MDTLAMGAMSMLMHSELYLWVPSHRLGIHLVRYQSSKTLHETTLSLLPCYTYASSQAQPYLPHHVVYCQTFLQSQPYGSLC